jgi:MFS family permease
LATGYLAATSALRPQPFYLGIGFALAGLLLSLFFVRDTVSYVRLEARQQDEAAPVHQDPASAQLSFFQVFGLTSWKNHSLFAASQAGLVNNLNDGLVWGLLPIFLAGFGLSLQQIGIIAAVYPGVWGVGQLFTGALSDRLGRKWLIAGGLWVQAAGIGLVVWGATFGVWVLAAVLMGIGTAMVYPTLLAAVGDVAHPSWRGSAVGVYRFWRDSGYAVGALLAGLLADAWGMEGAILVIAGLTALSGVVVAGVMAETLPQPRAVSTGAAISPTGRTPATTRSNSSP